MLGINPSLVGKLYLHKTKSVSQDDGLIICGVRVDHCYHQESLNTTSTSDIQAIQNVCGWETIEINY